MSPRIKLLGVISLSTAMILFPNFLFISAVSLLLTALLAGLRLTDRFASWLRPLALVFLVIVLLRSFPPPFLQFSVLGLMDGVNFSLRIYALILSVFLMVNTTQTSRLAEAFFFLPRDLRQILVISLTMLPNVSLLASKVMNAQKARGLNFRSPNVTRTYFPVMVPLLAKTLERSEKMALAMEARGFGNE